jgi:hypothetical protein
MPQAGGGYRHKHMSLAASDQSPSVFSVQIMSAAVRQAILAPHHGDQRKVPTNALNDLIRSTVSEI